MALEFETLGPYQIVSLLGRGGMGSVYKGVHAKSEQVVAVKVISPALADQPRFRRRFAAEVETLKRLKHPNIVELIGYGEERGYLFYSMEFVEGKSIQEILREDGPFSWQQVVDLMIEICSALKQAHDQGIIHRDLKPANVMIAQSGTSKLMDFGIAKLFGSTEVTAVGSIIGTADFMPPEQAEGRGVTSRSDIYSLGGLAYAAITGRPPFTGRSVPEVLYAVRYNPVTPIRDIKRETPKELAELIEEMLAKDPKDRPPTALVISNRLKALKVGLTRMSSTGTTGVEKSNTSAKEFTSIDLAELGVPSLLDEAKPTANDGTFVLQSQPESKVTRGPVPTRVPLPSSAGPDDRTLVATPSKLNADFEVGPASTSQVAGETRFTIVDEAERGTGASFGYAPTSNPWAQRLAVVFLTLLLVALLVSAYWYTRPDSSDVLYAKITALVETGSDSDLLDAAPLIDEFKERFPDDARSSELEPYLQDLEYVRTTRNLRFQSRLNGGRKGLAPIEQAFLDCMDARSSSPQLALRKLQAFLNVFAKEEQKSLSHRRLVELAEKKATQISNYDVHQSDPSLDALAEIVDAGLRQFSGEHKTRFLKSIIELFGDKPWAISLIDKCRLTLAELEKSVPVDR